VIIDSTFLPFTKSQTMRVHLAPDVAQQAGLPEKAVLKLYDRRWTDDRRYGENSWSPSRESAACARWRAIASGELKDDFEEISRDDWSEAHEEEAYRRLCKVSADAFLAAYR
jgi:hypothetical protein